MPRARRRCSRVGCDQLAPCPDHTPAPWSTSTRRVTLPPDWPARVAAVLTRDPTCRLAYPGSWTVAGRETRCTVTSREVDHVGAASDHQLTSLRGVCPECHARRTADQARTAAGLAGHARRIT